MAITVGTPTTSTSASFSHTSAGGTDLIVVGVVSYGGTSDTVTGITYNGVAMTVASQFHETLSPMNSAIFYLLAPASGSNTVAITISGSPTAYSCYAVDLTGVDTSSPIGTTLQNAVPSGSVNVTPTAASGAIFAAFGLLMSSGSPSIGNGTQINNVSFNATHYGSNLYRLHTGSVTNVSFTGSILDGAYAIAEIKTLVFTRTATDSIMNGASRTVINTRSLVNTRTITDSLMNGASRLATVSRAFTRILSDSILIAAGRFSNTIRVIVDGSTTIWKSVVRSVTSWTATNRD